MPSRMSCSLTITRRCRPARPANASSDQMRAAADHVDPARVHGRAARRAARGSSRSASSHTGSRSPNPTRDRWMASASYVGICCASADDRRHGAGHAHPGARPLDGHRAQASPSARAPRRGAAATSPAVGGSECRQPLGQPHAADVGGEARPRTSRGRRAPTRSTRRRGRPRGKARGARPIRRPRRGTTARPPPRR